MGDFLFTIQAKNIPAGAIFPSLELLITYKFKVDKNVIPSNAGNSKYSVCW